MKKNLIVKHNDFIEAKYNLTLTELKIIAKLSSMIKKDDDDFKVYKFTANELMEDLKLNNNYDDLKEAIRKLLTRLIIIRTEQAVLATTFLSSAEYFKNTTIELSFDKKLKPYLLQLKNNFTMYQFENVIALSSVYAIRIYELCKQYQKIKERIIKIEDLKEILDIEEKYKKYNDFKKKVLEIAEREINEKTDINISFEEIKIGRKVSAIRFLISAKKEIKAIKNKEIIENIEEVKEYPEEVLELFNILPFSEQVEKRKAELAELLKSHTFEYLKKDIEYCNGQSPAKYWGYFIKSVNSGHYSSDEVEKAKLKEQQKLKKKEQEEKLKKEQEERELKLKKLIEKKFKELTDEELQEYENKYKALPNAVKRATEKEILIKEWIREEMKQATA